MSNPNPNPATRFKKGQKQPAGAGRPAGLRDRITSALLTELANDFEKHGAKAVVAVRETDPTGYLRVMAGLLPKEIELKRPLEGVTDDKLAEAIDMLADVIRAQVPQAPPDDEDEPKVLQ